MGSFFGNVKSHMVAAEVFGLSDDSLIGSGLYANVYEFGENVLKVTVDDSYAALLADDIIHDPHLPRLIHAYGVIGHTVDGFEVYAFEFERLERLEEHPDRDLVRDLCEFDEIVNDNIDEAMLSGFHCLRSSVVMEIASEAPFLVPPSFRLFLSKMADICNVNEWEMDFHLGNVMFRRGTNEVVFADPVCPL